MYMYIPWGAQLSKATLVTYFDCKPHSPHSRRLARGELPIYCLACMLIGNNQIRLGNYKWTAGIFFRMSICSMCTTSGSLGLKFCLKYIVRQRQTCLKNVLRGNVYPVPVIF